MSVTVLTNDVAVFNCTAITKFIFWRVNDASAESQGFTNVTYEVLDSTQQLKMSSLQIDGLTGYNGFEIKCFISMNSCYDISLPAVLNILGKKLVLLHIYTSELLVINVYKLLL